MPKRLDDELSAIKEKLVHMGDLAQEMFQTAMKALVTRDVKLIARVNELETKVDDYQIAIDDDVIRLMTIHGPVALELRFVLMVARINTELERIGDQAVNMCEYVQLLLTEPELKRLIDLPRMSETASEMVRNSLQAFMSGNTQQALEVIQTDDKVDSLNDQIFRELLTYMFSDPKAVARAVSLILTARALERIADHATNIAEEVIYLVKGEDVRHQPIDEISRK